MIVHHANADMITHPEFPPRPTGDMNGAEFERRALACCEWCLSIPVLPALLTSLGIGGRRPYRPFVDPDLAESDREHFVASPIIPVAEMLANKYQTRRKAELAALADALAADLTIAITVQRGEFSCGNRADAVIAVNADGSRGAVITRFQRPLMSESEAESFAFAAAGGIADVD